MSLPAECIVLSLTTPSSPSARRKEFRLSGSGINSARERGRAWHPRPFRNF